jgi:hypothetical protein
MGGSRFLTDCVMARFAAVKPSAFASSDSTWPQQGRRSSRFAIKPDAKSAIRPTYAGKLRIREKLGLHEDVPLYGSTGQPSFVWNV